MTSLSLPLAGRAKDGQATVRWTALGFAYWFVFMAVLEPGNIQGALGTGGRLDWGLEVGRLVAAAMLGASVTPLLLLLARRFPVAGPRRRAGALWQGLAVVCLAPVLILVSCLLAAWLIERRPLPSWHAVSGQLGANTLLLIFCLTGFLALIQLSRRGGPALEAVPVWLERIAVKDRGRVSLVELADVDWIESQGNYQALHVGAAVHLVRQTSAGLEAQLDPARFVRIHRRTMIAVDRVDRLEPLPGGDGVVHLKAGPELRLSRGHRRALLAAL